MNLNQVTIPVSDVLKSIPFYQSLGLKLIVHTHDSYARFECTPNGSTLSLHKVEEIGNIDLREHFVQKCVKIIKKTAYL